MSDLWNGWSDAHGHGPRARDRFPSGRWFLTVGADPHAVVLPQRVDQRALSVAVEALHQWSGGAAVCVQEWNPEDRVLEDRPDLSRDAREDPGDEEPPP